MCIRSWLRRMLAERRTETHQLLLDMALSRYEARLSALPKERDSAVALLSVLLERDQVAAALAKEVAAPAIVQRLADLDGSLRYVAPQVSHADWDSWRHALNPQADRWWWRLDLVQTKAREERELLWVLLAGVFITVALSLAVQIITRMWSGGPDTLSVLSTILILALTSSPLTKLGRKLAGRLMEKARLSVRYSGEAMAGMAVLAFFLVLGLRLTLPSVAVVFNNRGYTLLEAGDLTGAQRAFQRAVSIDPDYAAAYYNLADAYVEIAEYDRAVPFYTQALVLDRTLDLAYNGLGHVFILQGEPERAIHVLYGGLTVAQDDVARTALWSNLGQAYLATGRYSEAEMALEQAIALNQQEATAHCALGLTAEALEDLESDIILHWENCLRYLDPTTARGRELANLAKVHLQELRGSKR